MSVLGTRYTPTDPSQRASYSGSRFFSAWGWASWRRAWSRYELHLGDWRSKCRVPGKPVPDLERPSHAGWSRTLDRVSRKAHPHTWDYQWSFAHFRHEGIALLPKSNLVTNIGGGTDATHLARGSVWMDLPRTPIDLPLIHPDRVEIDVEADRHREKWHLNHRPWLARKWWQFRNKHAIGSIETRRGVADYLRSVGARP